MDTDVFIKKFPIGRQIRFNHLDRGYVIARIVSEPWIQGGEWMVNVRSKEYDFLHTINANLVEQLMYKDSVLRGRK